LSELVLGADVAVLAHEGALPRIVALGDERHEHLSGEVAEKHGHIDAVDRKRVEELPIADIRAVDVGDEKQLDHLHTPEKEGGGGSNCSHPPKVLLVHSGGNSP
jgi:hypothetical protein